MVVPLGLDEAVFLQPIVIGDLVTITTRLVHATEATCRVFCTVDVLDPRDPTRLPKRSNRGVLVFAAEPAPSGAGGGGGVGHIGVVPVTYGDALKQIEAARRSEVEGPSDQEARITLGIFSKRTGSDRFVP